MAHIIIQNRFVEPGTPDFDAPLLVIEQGEGGRVTLRRANTPFSDRPIVIDPEQHFSPFALHVIYWGAGDFHYVTDQAETRDKEAFMRQHFGCSEGIIAEVGWGATPDQCAVLAFCAATYEGDYHRFERHDRSANFIDEVIPGFAARRLKYTNARRKQLAAISMADSVAELEKQVDFLTELVCKLSEKCLKPGDRPDWFDQFKTVVEARASTQFKTPEQNLAAIAQTKGQIRKVQSQYFDDKA